MQRNPVVILKPYLSFRRERMRRNSSSKRYVGNLNLNTKLLSIWKITATSCEKLVLRYECLWVHCEEECVGENGKVVVEMLTWWYSKSEYILEEGSDENVIDVIYVIYRLSVCRTCGLCLWFEKVADIVTGMCRGFLDKGICVAVFRENKTMDCNCRLYLWIALLKNMISTRKIPLLTFLCQRPLPPTSGKHLPA